MKKRIFAIMLCFFLFSGLSFGQVNAGWVKGSFRAVLKFKKQILLKELSAAPSHTSGYGTLYALSSDGDLYYKDDAGNVLALSTSDPTFDDVVVDKLECNESFTYDAVQTATGDGTTTIDWGLGNVFYFTFGAANETFTFTAPPGVAVLYLVLKQDATGSRTATWPGTVLWPGDVAPTLTTTAAYVDIITFITDGTNYFGIANYDFR